MKGIFLRNRFNIALIFGLLCAFFVSIAQFNTACDDLRTNVLRLHIIANSDSEPDQSLKLKIRDELLKCSMNVFENANGVNDATFIAEENLGFFEEIANKVIFQNGFSYTARAKVGNSYFETREYDDFTLPAGEYKSLIITLGEGQGKNWWCVVFPEICIPAATDASLNDVAAESSVKIAQNSEKYVMKFKFIEVYEDIKYFFRKKFS